MCPRMSLLVAGESADTAADDTAADVDAGKADEGAQVCVFFFHVFLNGLFYSSWQAK